VTTTEIVLLCALVAAGAALITLLRRPRAGSEDGALVRAEVARLADGLARQDADERELRADVGRLRETLEALRAGAEARARAEGPVWEAVRRLEAVLAGGGARGRPGENLLEEALSSLPPGMLLRDYAINGRRVEFALVLPDGRRMPVDSKWTAGRELEALEAEEEQGPARDALCRRIEEEVVRRAREVSAYLDASATTPFAVACIPDAAFSVCRRAHADAFARGVVLVPYSTALPVLLALYALGARFGADGDVDACLAELEATLAAMETTLENKVARAGAMLRSATDEWRALVGRARIAVARGRGVDQAGRGRDDEQTPPQGTPPASDLGAFVDFERTARTG
jgi:hypothetical protein